MNKSATSSFILALTVVLSAALMSSPFCSNAAAKEKVWRLKAQAFTVPGKYDCQ